MNVNIASSEESISQALRDAEYHFYSEIYNTTDLTSTEVSSLIGFYVRRAFIELLMLLEAMNLPETRKDLTQHYQEAKHDLTKSEMGPDEPYLIWPGVIRQYVTSLFGVFGLDPKAVQPTHDLKRVFEQAVYTICDTELFGHSPSSEADVHDRLEGILRCQYPDLKRKPTLSKPIKNFEPDTGIPSIKTLVEYKFVTTKLEAKRVVDEILADASAYRSREWKHLLYVIYETHRVFPQNQWKSLLEECELLAGFDVQVLCGDSRTTTKPKKKGKRSAPRSTASSRKRSLA